MTTHTLTPRPRVVSPILGVAVEAKDKHLHVERFTPVLLGSRVFTQPHGQSVDAILEIAAAGLIDAQEANLVDLILRATAWTLPVDWHIAAFTTGPSADTGAGAVEPVGNGYGRIQATRNGTNWAAAVAGDPTIGDNAVALTSPTASGGNWGTLVAFGAYDAASAGNLFWFGDYAVSKTVNDGDNYEFAIGALDFKVGDPGDTF